MVAIAINQNGTSDIERTFGAAVYGSSRCSQRKAPHRKKHPAKTDAAHTALPKVDSGPSGLANGNAASIKIQGGKKDPSTAASRSPEQRNCPVIMVAG